MTFTDAQIERYSRQLLLSEIGGAGQRKLAGARVLCVGAGGLGSPAALYLAAAGVGHIGIADADCVDLSNLQRQLLHDTPSLGVPKVESARETLQRLNPEVEVIPHHLRVGADNVAALIADYDLVVDGADNFGTRFLLNDACYFAGTPLCHGGILQFRGQATTLLFGDGPCYRCLYPEPPLDAGDCRTAGVLGAVAGVIGAVMATEALKLILGLGEPLAGRLLVYDALALVFRELRYRKTPDCPLCGAAPSITALAEYDSCE